MLFYTGYFTKHCHVYIHQNTSKKKHFTKILFVLACFLLCPALRGSFSCARESRPELMILWNAPLDGEEAAACLASLFPQAILTDHIEDLSICVIPTSSPSSVLAVLNQDSRIRIAERNAGTELTALTDAAYYPAQWYLNNTGEYPYYINNFTVNRPSTPDLDINLPEAVSILETMNESRTVTVAVIDTGVDITHPDLAGHIWVNDKEIPNNGIDDDGNGYIDDIYGWDFYHNDNTVFHYDTTMDNRLTALASDDDTHGTHCAGIIAASGGVCGVASAIDVQILTLKIHGGIHASGSVANAVKAIKYAQAAGADICNLSWGTTIYSELLETVMRESSMLFVVAAGNNKSNNNAAPLYPSNFALDNMISVAYVTPFGSLAADSNYGSSTVDLAAPGQDIYSTAVGGGYRYLSGSSMAAPVVSGIAALLYSCGDSLYPQNVKELLLQTIKPLDTLVGYVRYAGIPDAAAALSARDLLVSDTIPPTLSPETSFRNQEILVTLHPEDLGGSGCRILAYAAGKRPISFFKHGTAGYTSSGTTVSLSKAGTYTFYASDYAGNETVSIYEVGDDTDIPELSASYKKNADGQFLVTLHAFDAKSGIKRLRYLQGSHSEEALLAFGLDLPLENPSFTTSTEGIYSVYAIDYRGNKTVYEFDLRARNTVRLFLSTQEITLEPGESFVPGFLCFPLDTTDDPLLSLLDDFVARLDHTGTVTALAPGDTALVVSAGTVTKNCIIHVVEPQSPQEDTLTEGSPMEDTPLEGTSPDDTPTEDPPPESAPLESSPPEDTPLEA